MKFKLPIAFISVLIIINVFIFYLFIDGQLRHKTLRFTAEIQNMLFQHELSVHNENKNFAGMILTIDERLDYLKSLTTYSNTQAKSFFEGVKKSFELSERIETKKSFNNILEKITSEFPKNYSMRLLLAQSYGNDQILKAYEEIDNAIELIGASPDAYRLGINLALKTKNKNKLEKYCSEYQINQFGGKSYNELDPLQVQELGLRRLGLNIFSENEYIYVENKGVSIGEDVDYEFILPKTFLVNDNFTLFLPLAPGTSIEIKSIKFYKSGKQVRDENNENFTLSARDAFFDTHGRILRSENENPERINFIFANQNKSVSVDKINIVISIRRLELFSKSTCNIFN
jgi:hypothetical protein